MLTLKIYKTHPDILLPKFETQQSACFDIAYQPHGKYHVEFYNDMNKPVTRQLSSTNGTVAIIPNERALIPTGLIFDIPVGYSLRIHPRSGVSVKNGVTLINGEGVIDSDYVEELFILLHNASYANFTLQPGTRVAQAELVKSECYKLEEVSERPVQKTNRLGGMGSTGMETSVEAPLKRKRGRPKKIVDNPPVM
jgi:dUTP pyrophosphatase